MSDTGTEDSSVNFGKKRAKIVSTTLKSLKINPQAPKNV